jgi:hypothetical protein
MNQIDNIMALADEYAKAAEETGYIRPTRQALRAAIEQALAVQPKQEPVAWRWKYRFKDIGETGAYEYHSHEFAALNNMPNGEPLYTAPQPQPEKRPQNCGTGFCSCIECPYSDHFADAGKPMEREWVGLTDEEIDGLDYLVEATGYCSDNLGVEGTKDFAHAIEAKLREKNT